MMKNEKMNNKGFSLVELIIVIAIMAVLIGVLAPQLYKYVEKSKEAKDITNLDTCVSAVQTYYADKEFPSGGVAITVEGGVFKADDSNKSLTDANLASSAVTGTWTNLGATISATGVVTYTGSATYYENDGTKGFKTKE